MALNKYEKLKILSFIVIFFVGTLVVYQMLKKPTVLPIYNPSDLNPKLVDESVRDVTKNHQISSFSLVNQDGKNVNENLTENKIYVTDFFFTTCPTICPKMAKQMKRVYAEFEDEQGFMILSHTVYPENDSTTVLKKYAEELGVNTQKWVFLTGDKKVIYDLARKSYFAATTEGDGGISDFIHTENFVLVDTKRQIRGFYDGTSTEEVSKLIEDIQVLLKEQK